MKKPNLSLVTLRHRVPNKYTGEPDDPHFIPSSPLIERRAFGSKQEAELKQACQLLVSEVKAYERGGGNGLSKGKDAKQADGQTAKHDKHASFTFHGTKAPGILQNRTTKEETRKSHVKAGVNLIEPWDQTQRRKSHQSRATYTDTEEEALFDIRSKLEFRPKTSAAACIDYHGAETSSSSNRTSRTTPFTSAGITPGSTSKRFSQNLPDLTAEGIDPVPSLPFEDSITRLNSHSATHLLLPSPNKFTHNYQHEDQANNDQSVEKLLKPWPSSPSQPVRVRQQSPSRAGPNPEYVRRGSTQITSGKLGSSRAESIHSNAASSIYSPMRHSFFAIRQKFSRRGSNVSGVTGCDQGDEYLINASKLHLDTLNRPLPPLPGLDSYVEPKSRHIADMFLRPRAKTTQAHSGGIRIVNDDGTERILTAQEEAQRREDMSRAVLEKMTTGSIGSGAAGVASPTNRMSQQTMHTSANISAFDGTNGSNLSRPLSTYSTHKSLLPQSPMSDKKLPIQSKTKVQRKSASHVALSDVPSIPSLAGKDFRQHYQRAFHPSCDNLCQDIELGSHVPANATKDPFFKRVFGKKKAK